MDSFERFDGRCACGQVRYRMTATPIIVHACHCRWCQRETGSAFAINALIESDRVELIAGDVEAVVVPSESGAGQTIVRCSRCRIALWSNYSDNGDVVRFIRVGTLDAPDRFPPDVHIFTASRQPWLRLPDDRPAYEAYYDTTAAWPVASLERIEALKAKRVE